MGTTRQLRVGASLRASSATCTTSSRVGARIMAWGPGSLRSRHLSRNGSRKAAVLPVPVWAWPITSRPSRACGIRAAWIGVGWTYSARSRAARIGGVRDREWKPWRDSTSSAVVKQTSQQDGKQTDSVYLLDRSCCCYFKSFFGVCLVSLAGSGVPGRTTWFVLPGSESYTALVERDPVFSPS